jgi:APA family basic amino acid/polyamine antiporter
VVFYCLNLLGVDIFAKVQNLMVIILIASLAMFALFGIGKVQWGTYFVHDDGWMTGGLMGLCQAGGLLTFATGGATSVVNFSAEAKNPTRDIPLVIIISTLGVAIIYAFIAFVAAGVLPIEEVAGKNLTITANVILNRPLYILFVVGGAGCALASTLNNQLASTPKPIMQMCDDGWLPQQVASLNKRNSPFVIQTFLYILAVVCVLTGLSISTLSNMCILASAVSNVVIGWNTRKLPEMVPNAWAHSKFKVSQGVLTLMCVLATAASLFNTYLNASSLSTTMLIINVGIIAFAVAFGFVRANAVHMDLSYEEIVND